MNNYIQEGDRKSVTLGAGVNSGDVVVMGEQVGVAQKTGATGDLIEVSLKGVYSLPKKSTDTFTDGEKLYWDAGNDQLTTSADNGASPLVTFVYIGHSWGAYDSTVVTAKVKLHNM